MKFLDLLEEQGDKVMLSELILLQKKLPTRVTAPIPACMYKNIDTGKDNQIPELDYEVFNLLAWVIARRENPEILPDEVADRIGMGNREKLREVVKNIWYFYSAKTRDEVEETFGEQASEEPGEEAPVNPPQPSPSNSS